MLFSARHPVIPAARVGGGWRARPPRADRARRAPRASPPVLRDATVSPPRAHTAPPGPRHGRRAPATPPSPPEARVCAMPHHLVSTVGAATARAWWSPEKNPVRSGTSTLADVGLGTPVALDRAVKVGVRVTVELPDEPPDDSRKIAAGRALPRDTPRRRILGIRRAPRERRRGPPRRDARGRGCASSPRRVDTMTEARERERERAARRA